MCLRVIKTVIDSDRCRTTDRLGTRCATTRRATVVSGTAGTRTPGRWAIRSTGRPATGWSRSSSSWLPTWWRRTCAYDMKTSRGNEPRGRRRPVKRTSLRAPAAAAAAEEKGPRNRGRDRPPTGGTNRPEGFTTWVKRVVHGSFEMFDRTLF